VIGVLIVALAATAVGVLSGGSLESLAATSVRFLWIVYVALIVQVGAVILDPSWLSNDGALWLLLTTNVAIAAFLLINRRLPGMLIAAAGLLLNVAVITANGAMPVSDAVLDTAGVSEAELDTADLKHERMTDDTVLPWLGDVIVIPWLREVWSAGDVVLAGGIAYFIWKRTRAAVA
jgi:Family of unknown function (DUF5317)